MTTTTSRRLGAWLLAGASVLLATVLAQTVLAQRRGWTGAPGPEPPISNVPYDGRFTFARLKFTTGPGGYYFRGLPAWAHGYPRAERNLVKILNSVSNLAPRLDATNVVTFEDPELYHYPLTYMTEPGFLTMTDREVEAFRTYFQRGGFVIFDDFRGPDWENFETQMRRVLPQGRLIELDVKSPLFHSFFEIPTLEFHQFYDRGTPQFYGMFEDNDPKKRLLLIANYDNDVSEYWEFSDTGFVPIDLSNEAYKLAVDYVIYGMTH